MAFFFGGKLAVTKDWKEELVAESATLALETIA